MLEQDAYAYPHQPGFKRRGTSEDAADAIAPNAATLRAKVRAALEERPMTADETADYLGVDKLSIRPRFSELSAVSEIEDSGLRRQNRSGKKAIVWQRVKEFEGGLF